MMGFRATMTAAIAVVLCLALGIIGLAAQRIVARTVEPEITAKAQALARSSAELVERALELGIPLDRLNGVDAHFAGLRADNPEIASVALEAPDGRALVQAGEAEAGVHAQERIVVPVRAGETEVARLAMTVDADVVSGRVRAVLIDVAFLGIVAMLIALEIAALLTGARLVEGLTAIETRLFALWHGNFARQPEMPDLKAVVAPIDAPVGALRTRHESLRARALAAGDANAVAALDAAAQRYRLGEHQPGENWRAAVVRPALFVFMLAEELTRPFLPRFAQSIAPHDGPFAVDLMVSLPLVVFMAVVALGQLPFAALSERLGRRTGFMIGAGLAAAGYAASAFSTDYGIFVAARLVSGLGYCLVFVSAQGHVVDHARPAERALSLAVFVRAIMVAALCGPPLGGVLADAVGDQRAFFAAAVVALAGLVLAFLSLPKGRSTRHADGLKLGDLKAALRAPGFMALLLGCAFPAKMILAALCFYLVPVEMQRQGYSAAAIGRFQMIYPVIMVFAVPVFARLADRLDRRSLFVVLGGLIAGGGALFTFAGVTPVTLAAMLVALAVGQAMSIAPQSALVADYAGQMPGGNSSGVLGLFRLVERSGNAVGAAVGGALLGAFGLAAATGFIGVFVMAGAAGFALVRTPKSVSPATEAALDSEAG